MDDVIELQKIRKIEEARIIEKFLALGWKIIKSNSSIASKEEFFILVKNSELPLDPPLVGDGNWDAFEDSLSAGLIASEEPGFLVLLSKFEKFKENSPKEWSNATEILLHLSRQTKKIKILLVDSDEEILHSPVADKPA